MGGYSQIKCELNLLKLATSTGKYLYYHLLSGEDLPIKTQNEIHKFFKQNYQKQFIRFQTEKFEYYDRVQYYHLFREKINRNRRYDAFLILETVSLKLQKLVGIKRNKNVAFQKGTNWFSITDDLARYILTQEEWIKKTFRKTFCCDEVFLQTIVHNSKYKEELYYKKYDNSNIAIMRLIDWKRGTPYIFKQTDFEEIMHSECMFARKFDADVDNEIISMIRQKLDYED